MDECRANTTAFVDTTATRWANNLSKFFGSEIYHFLSKRSQISQLFEYIYQMICNTCLSECVCDLLLYISSKLNTCWRCIDIEREREPEWEPELEPEQDGEKAIGSLKDESGKRGGKVGLIWMFIPPLGE